MQGTLVLSLENLKQSQGLSFCLRFHRALSRTWCAHALPWKSGQRRFFSFEQLARARTISETEQLTGQVQLARIVFGILKKNAKKNKM